MAQITGIQPETRKIEGIGASGVGIAFGVSAFQQEGKIG